MADKDREKQAAALESLSKKLKSRELSKDELLDAGKGKEIVAQLLGITRDELYELSVKGFSFIQSGYFKEAEQTFEALAFLDMSQPYFQNALGVALLAQNKFEKAEICFRKAIKLDPAVPSHYVNLGEVLKKTGRVEEAFQAYEEADRRDPEKKDYFVNRSRQLMEYIRQHGGLENAIKQAEAEYLAMQQQQSGLGGAAPTGPRHSSTAVPAATAPAPAAKQPPAKPPKSAKKK